MSRQPPGEADAKQALSAMLEARLATVLGVRLSLLERLAGGRGAAALGLAWLLLYGAAFAFATWWSTGGTVSAGGHARLFSLNLWNGLHFAALIVITRLATPHVLDIVGRDILRFASDDYAAAVRATLERQPVFLLLRVVPFTVAALAAATALWNISHEIRPLWWDARPFPLDLLFWIAVSFGIYFASVKVVLTTTFSRAFAARLEEERSSFYPLGAADSPLVRGLARLNRALLAYWTAAFAVILTAMLLLLPPAPFALAEGSPYLFVLIPVAGFGSLGVATLVYLGNEAAIRSVLRRYTLERAEPLQRQIDRLLRLPDIEKEENAATVERLVRLHERILAGGSYGSRIGVAVSVALPLALPAIGLIEKLLAGSGEGG